MEIKEGLDQIELLVQQGQFDEIEDLAWDLMDEHPESTEILMALGAAAIKGANFSRADFYFMNAKIVDANNTAPIFALAELSILLKDFSRSRGYYSEILNIDSSNVLAQLGMADTFYEAELYIDAAQKYHEVLQNNAKEALNDDQFSLLVYKAASSYFVVQELDKALELIEEYAPAGFNELIELAKLKVYQAYGPTHAAETADCLDKLHQNNASEPDYIIPLIPFVKQDNDQAKLTQLFDALLKLELSVTQKEDALCLRAQNSIETSNWSLALEDLTSLIALNEKWTYYQDAAMVKVELKDAKGALQDLTKAISMAPDSTILYSERGSLLAKAKLFDKAIADFEKILSLNALDREKADALYNIGVAYTKLKDKPNAIKSLMKAELMGNVKARDFLMKNFADKLSQVRTSQRAKHKAAYEGAATRNQKSPILSKAMGQLWVPNMSKVFKVMEPEMDTMPAKIIKAVLEDASKDLFLITEDALLLIEGDREPLEAYYKVLVESEHSVLVEVQPSKGGPTENMRLSFFEGNLLMAYPDAEGGGANDWKYFMTTNEVTEDQKNRLTTKKIDLPYAETLEASIASIAG